MNPQDQFRQNYHPDPVDPIEVTEWTTPDLVILWLSGVNWGLVIALLWL